MTAAATDQTNQPSQQNLFGICARVGEDFGFNPLWLRLAFASALIFDPVVVIGSYFALGALVLLSRVLFPKRGTRPAAALVTVAPAPQREAGEDIRLPLAA